jgi:cobaltochelatase CobN
MFFDATLGNSDISTFMEDANPEAFAALKKRFEALDKAGLWVTRRNSIRASLEAAQ